MRMGGWYQIDMLFSERGWDDKKNGRMNTEKKKKIEKVGSLFGLELAQKSMSPQFY